MNHDEEHDLEAVPRSGRRTSSERRPSRTSRRRRSGFLRALPPTFRTWPKPPVPGFFESPNTHTKVGVMSPIAFDTATEAFPIQIIMADFGLARLEEVLDEPGHANAPLLAAVATDAQDDVARMLSPRPQSKDEHPFTPCIFMGYLTPAVFFWTRIRNSHAFATQSQY